MLQSTSSSSSPSPRYITRSQSSARPSPVSSALPLPVVSTFKPIKISSTAFNAARKYLELASKQDKEIDMESSELLLAENVSLESFIRYMEKNPKPLVKIRLDNGKIKAYEVPYGEHGLVTVMIACMVFRWTNVLGGITEYDVIVSATSMRQPDYSIVPEGRPRPPYHLRCNDLGQPYPTVVVEVGQSQSLSSLDKRTEGYFSQRTTIQVYLAIKIYSRFPDHTRALVAMLYLRTNADPLVPMAISFGTRPLHQEVVEILPNIGVQQTLDYPPIPPQPNPYAITGVGFGGPPCNTDGIQDYQLNIPAALIFNGVPGGIPAGLAHGLNLDLYEIQRKADAVYR